MENNFFGSKLNTFLLFVLIIVLAYTLWFMMGTRIPKDEVNNIQDEEVTLPAMEGNVEDLISFSIAPNSTISGIRSYRGSIKGGYFFEANILINITDVNGNYLLQSNAVATSDWMTADPVEFEGFVDFRNLPKGPAYFQIHNDNASGLPENDKSISIPITIE